MWLTHFNLVSSMFWKYMKTLALTPDLEQVATIDYTHKIDLAKIYANQIHIKRDERLEAFQSILDNPNYLSGLKVDVPEAKVKNETVKHKIKNGKVEILPRQFISLGARNTVLEGSVTEALKSSFSKVGEVPLTHCKFTFVKEGTINLMDEIMNEICDYHSSDAPNSPIKFFYHSDDSNITFRCPLILDEERPGSFEPVECIVTADIDISTCDASHGPIMFCLFEFISWICSVDNSCLIDQCYLPFSVFNPKPKSTDFGHFDVPYGKMYTGFGGTTAMNNCASILIGCSLVAAIRTIQASHENQRSNAPRLSELKAILKYAAEFVGYQVTVDLVWTDYLRRETTPFLPHLGDITLLKHYPAMVESTTRFVALPCIGRLMRNFGISEKPLSELPVDHLKNVVRSYLSQHSSFVSRKLSLVALDCDLNEVPLSYDEYDIYRRINLAVIENRSYVRSETTTHRYSTSLPDLEEGLELFFRTMQPRLVLHPSLDGILAKDYALIAADQASSS
jgi:hypothetical protein